MVKEVTYAPKFNKNFEKLDKSYSIRLKKLIQKIINTPEIGKPMRFNRKGTREVYVNPFRLSYAYDKTKDVLYFLDIYHKDEQ